MVLAKILKEYTSVLSLVESQEFKDLWKGFQGIDRSKKMYLEIYENNFVGAYMIECDPQKHYGSNYQLVIVGEIENTGGKFNRMNKIDINAILAKHNSDYVCICKETNTIESLNIELMKRSLNGEDIITCDTNIHKW